MKLTGTLSSGLVLLSLIQAATGQETISKDVCIIGGGSSGTYSAIRLQQMGKNVALVEKESRLGGHVNTYVDPTTQKTLDIGVILFENTSIVRDYFSSLGVPLGPASFDGTNVFADFQTGDSVPAPEQDPVGIGEALLTYNTLLSQYPYLVNGFDLPTPLPEDLLITWGEFLDKYDLDAISFLAYKTNQGVGNILDLPMLYFFKYLNGGVVDGLLTNGLITTADNNNQGFYNVALDQLGTNAFISSNVTNVTRTDKGVEVCMSTPDGPKIIQAKKLLVTIPPTLVNLGFMDLDDNESSIFGQFNSSYYWVALVKDSGIPAETSVNNLNPTAPHQIPAFPGAYLFGAAPAFGVHSVYYSSPSAISDDEVKAEILAALGRITRGLGFPPSNSTPEIIEFHAHNPFELQVSVDAYKTGFYARLEALQGPKSTFYTGAAWQAQDSSAIWSYTEKVVLPMLTNEIA